MSEGVEMFLNEKACRIIIALRELGEANISEVARVAGANVGHTSNTLTKAILRGYVIRERTDRGIVHRLTEKGRRMAEVLEETLRKIESIESEEL